MPWTVDDVERHVKGLTPKQKRQWVAVANSALKRCQDEGGDNCDGKAIRQANGVVKSSEAPTPIAVRPLLFSADQPWIAYLPRPGTYQHGLYGELDLTPEKLSRIVDNFHLNVYGQDLPINAEHDLNASGAVGWITDMRLAADGSIEVQPTWNDRGQALLAGDRFRYVSAEFFDSWQDPVSGDWHPDVPVGLAICTRPHFKTDVLRPLAATEAEALAMENEPIRWGADETPPEQHDLSEVDASKEQERMTEHEEENVEAQATEPEQDEAQPVVVATEPVTVTLTEQTVKRFQEMEKRLAATEHQLAEERTGRAVEQREHRIKRFTDEARGRSDANNNPYLGDIEAHVAFMIDLAEKFGESSAQMQHYLTVMRSAAEREKQSNLFKQIGTNQGAEPMAPLEKIALFAREKRLADSNLTQQQAEALALREHPELYEAYVKS